MHGRYYKLSVDANGNQTLWHAAAAVVRKEEGITAVYAARRLSNRRMRDAQSLMVVAEDKA